MKDYLNTNQLYRDTVRARVSGVCAGLARHFNVDAWVVRLATIAAFIFFPFPVAIAYVLGVVLIPTH